MPPDSALWGNGKSDFAGETARMPVMPDVPVELSNHICHDTGSEPFMLGRCRAPTAGLRPSKN